MKKILPWFEVLCIDYALIIVLNSISNILLGYNSTDLWNVEIFIFTAVTIFIWNLIDRINFRYVWSYYLVQGIAIYALMMICSYFFNWFSFDTVTIIAMTIRYVLIFTVITIVLRRRYIAEAAQINELINKK